MGCTHSKAVLLAALPPTHIRQQQVTAHQQQIVAVPDELEACQHLVELKIGTAGRLLAATAAAVAAATVASVLSTPAASLTRMLLSFVLVAVGQLQQHHTRTARVRCCARPLNGTAIVTAISDGCTALMSCLPLRYAGQYTGSTGGAWTLTSPQNDRSAAAARAAPHKQRRRGSVPTHPTTAVCRPEG